VKNETKIVIYLVKYRYHTTDPRQGGGATGDQTLLLGKISKEIKHCSFTLPHGDQTLFIIAVQARVPWPIYRAILLVPTILIQPIPIIIGVGCIKIVNTKNIDLWCYPH
jgi:hypothetical protein